MPIGYSTQRLNLRATLACLLTLSCSDASYRLGGETEASSSGAVRTGLCVEGADVELIDDMEDGDGTIALIASRSGVWFSFNDKTAGAQDPVSDEETFVMSELAPPRGASHFAARTHGGGFTKWGAGIGFELYSQKAYDLSRYAGISFWARRAPSTTSALRFAMTDAATTPRGGQCREYADYSGCNDHFGADLNLGTAFHRYSFDWAQLQQEGWGDPQPASLDAAHVYGVRFQTDPVEDFDFWIDDVALLCHPG
jgi:hypothetical protein